MISSTILIWLLVIEPHMVKQSNNEVGNIYHRDDVSVDNKFKSLSDINSDIKGWIFISGTHINYPVLYDQSDSMFYLNHNYKKEFSRYGSIFIDPSCKLGTDSKNIILHGHHMNDGQMFADILKFADIDFYKSNPIIEFDTPDEPCSWKIISVFKTNTLPEHGKLFNYLVSEFHDSNDFLQFIHEIKKRSLIEIPIDINEDDKILTLSTCSYEFKDFRTVVVARKIRKDENRIIDIENTRKAVNPLMPDCWYKH